MSDPLSVEKIGASWLNSYARCFAPWSRMTPEEWAEEVYRLPNGGRFKWDFAPYTRAMYQSMFDRRVIETSYAIFSRGLKSTVILLAIGYTIDQRPRRILYMMPTTGQVEKFSKDNLCGELLDTTPCLNPYGSKGNRRITSNTILHKAFPGGLITMFGANAPGELRRAKGSFLVIDEKDAIQQEEGDEGDQVQIFWKRGSEYPDTIRVSASYPSLRGHSRIINDLENSDWNEWHVTCVKCGGEPFVMHRKMLRYDKGKPEGARLECPRCGEFLTDAERYAMAHGQGFDNWKPRNEFRGRRGFHANSMLWPHPVDYHKYPAGYLGQLAEEEMAVAASADPKRAMRPLVNTVDAEPFDPTEESEKAPDWKPLYDRREDYGLTVPERGLFLTAFTDCQKNRLEVGWQAWGRNDESWFMDHVVIEGYVGHREVWQELRRQLGRKWKHASGAPMSLGFAFVDGGAYSEDVYRFFQELARNPEPGVYGHVQASKGIGTHPHPIVTHGQMKTIAKTLKGRHIGTWQAKDRIYERLRMSITDGEIPEGYIHFNKQFREEFFQGLTIETATQKINGPEIYNTYKDEVSGNEALDIAVGNLAAWRLYPRNFDTLEETLALTKPDAPAPVAPSAWFKGKAPSGWNL